MSELTFYTNPMSRGQTARWMLEEVGEPYETVILDYGTTMKAEPYLSVNPMGKVPAIAHRGKVVTEVAAICCYLADAFPDAGLAPSPADRADYYRWIFFTSGPVEAAFSNRAAGWEPTPERQRMFGYGNYDLAIATLEKALTGKRYIAGDRFTAADLFVGANVNFMLQFNLLDPRPVFTDYAARMTDRDAYRRAKEIDGKLIAEMQAQQAQPMHDPLRQEAIRLYDRFTHEGMDRRLFMGRMVALTGSIAAAEALVGAIAASPAAAAIVPENNPRLTTRTITLASPVGYRAYVAEPRSRSLKPTVLVIHENRGLNDHIRDVARRLAVAGYRAVAPDLLSPAGGTPDNEDAAREAIGKLDLAAATAAGVAMLDELAKTSRGRKVGAIGFCWGGAYIHRLAVAAGSKLAAGVSYYGPAPEPAEAARVQAPLMVHVPALDSRVKATAWPWVEALRKAGKSVTAYDYPGANHAFNNDTSAERYDKAAADLAWARTLRFFGQHLRA